MKRIAKIHGFSTIKHMLAFILSWIGASLFVLAFWQGLPEQPKQ